LILDTRQGRSLAVGGYAQAGGLHGDTIAMLTFSLGDTPAGPWHFVQAVRLEGSKRIPLKAVLPVPASYCKVSFSNQDTVPLDATLYYEVLSGEVSGIEHRFPYQAVTNWANLANGSLQVTTVNNFGSYHVHSLSVTLIGLPSIPWSVDVRAIPDSGSTGYLLCDGSNLVASLTGSNGSPVPVTHPYCASNRNGVAIFELPFDLVSLYMLPYFSLSFKCGAGSFGTVRTVVNGERPGGPRGTRNPPSAG
jgi:hypothetical protein